MEDEGHSLPGQHGSRSPPQDSQLPVDVQTSILVPSGAQRAPAATQVGVAEEMSQHAPPLQRSLQQGWPAPPHAWHEPFEHTLAPPAHCSPLTTHCLALGSQQPS